MSPRVAELLVARTPSTVKQTAAAVRQLLLTQASSGTTLGGAAALNSTPLANSVIHLSIFANTALTISSVVGGGVTTWNAGVNSAPAGGLMISYYGVVTGTPSSAITVTLSGTISYANMTAYEITGGKPSAPVDTQQATSGTGTTITVPALTLGSAGEVIISQTWSTTSVTGVSDNSFTDLYNPVGNYSQGSYAVLGNKATYTTETYTQTSGPWYSQATAYTSVTGSGQGGGGGASVNGYTKMGAPAYPGSTWSAANLTADDNFASLGNWNYGISDTTTSGSSGGYYPWAASGTAPYWGSSESGPSNIGVSDYDYPGNVSQTSSGANASLFKTYSPQSFSPAGWGVTFTAVYEGPYTQVDVYGTQNFLWSSGAINSFNHIYGPSGSYTQVYFQIRAQQMGYQGSNNGSWNAIWFLGQGNSDREIDLQETGLGGQSPDLIVSHLQAPPSAVEINPGGGAYNTGVDLSAGYHIYGMELVGGTVNIYCDNVKVGTGAAGTSGPYFLILNGAISQGTYSATPTNFNPMTMNIMEVQMYER